MSGSVVPHAKFDVYQGNVSPLWDVKPIFGPLSKNNTGMAVIRMAAGNEYTNNIKHYHRKILKYQHNSTNLTTHQHVKEALIQFVFACVICWCFRQQHFTTAQNAIHCACH